MARISKETYGKLLEQLGYEQHAVTKTLYILSVNEKQYGVDIKGKEPDVFEIAGTSRNYDNQLTDPIIKSTIAVLLGEDVAKERAMPVDSKAEQEYCNATPEVNEGETRTELPQGSEAVTEEEYPPSEISEQANDTYDDDYVNEEPIEVIEPEYVEPEIKKTMPEPIPMGTHVFSCIQNMDLQLAEAGKIKIGKKQPPKANSDPNGFRPPMKLDHFIVTTTEKDKKTGDMKLDEKVMRIIKDDCRVLKVSLPYDTIELNFQSSYARYTSSKCLCRGDGKTARDDKGNIIPCDPKTCEFALGKTCKPSGILSVILEDAPGIGGVYKFRTTSWNSIRNIYSALHFITTKTGGILAGIPLNMVLLPKTVNIPNGKGTTVIYMVNLEIPVSMSEMRRLAREEAKLRADTLIDTRKWESEAVKQLAPPEPTEEEVKEITEEFFPELHQ